MIGGASAGGRKWLALWATFAFAVLFSLAAARKLHTAHSSFMVKLIDPDMKTVARGTGKMTAHPEVVLDFVKASGSEPAKWALYPKEPSFFKKGIKSIFELKSDTVKITPKSSKVQFVALPKGVLLAKHVDSPVPLTFSAVGLLDHRGSKRVLTPLVEKTEAPKKKLIKVFDGFNHGEFSGYVGAHTKVHEDGTVNLPSQEELKAFYDAFYTPELSAERRQEYDAAVAGEERECKGVRLYDLNDKLYVKPIPFEDWERKVFLKEATDKKDEMYHNLGAVRYVNYDDKPVPAKRSSFRSSHSA